MAEPLTISAEEFKKRYGLPLTLTPEEFKKRYGSIEQYGAPGAIKSVEELLRPLKTQAQELEPAAPVPVPSATTPAQIQQFDDSFIESLKRSASGITQMLGQVPAGFESLNRLQQRAQQKYLKSIGAPKEFQEVGEKEIEARRQAALEPARATKAFAEKYIGAKPGSPKDFDAFLRSPLKVGLQLGIETVPMTALLAGVTAINPIAGQALLFGVEAGETEAAFDEMERQGVKVDPLYRDLAVVSKGALNSALEKIGINKILEKAPPGIKGKLVKILSSASVEGFTEGLQEVNGVLAESGVALNRDQAVTLKSAFDNALTELGKNKSRLEEAALGGFVAGGATDVMVEGAQRMAENYQQKRAEKQPPPSVQAPVTPSAPPPTTPPAAPGTIPPAVVPTQPPATAEPSVSELERIGDEISQEVYGRSFAELNPSEQDLIVKTYEKEKAKADAKKVGEAIAKRVAPKPEKVEKKAPITEPPPTAQAQPQVEPTTPVPAIAAPIRPTVVPEAIEPTAPAVAETVVPKAPAAAVEPEKPAVSAKARPIEPSPAIASIEQVAEAATVPEIDREPVRKIIRDYIGGRGYTDQASIDRANEIGNEIADGTLKKEDIARILRDEFPRLAATPRIEEKQAERPAAPPEGRTDIQIAIDESRESIARLADEAFPDDEVRRQEYVDRSTGTRSVSKLVDIERELKGEIAQKGKKKVKAPVAPSPTEEAAPTEAPQVEAEEKSKFAISEKAPEGELFTNDDYDLIRIKEAYDTGELGKIEDITQDQLMRRFNLGNKRARILLNAFRSRLARLAKPETAAAPRTLESLKSWTGKAYRVDTGFKHDAGATAAQVAKYEQEDLGNDLGITDDLLSALKEIPATNVVWVTRTPKDAKRYGKPSEIELPEGSKILAEDGDGGFLILKPTTKAKAPARPALPPPISADLDKALLTFGSILNRMKGRPTAEQQAEVRRELEAEGTHPVIIDELVEPRRTPRPSEKDLPEEIGIGDAYDLLRQVETQQYATTRKGRIERAVDPPAELKQAVNRLASVGKAFGDSKVALQKAKEDIITEIEQRGGEVIVNTKTGAFTIKINAGKARLRMEDLMQLKKLRAEAAEAGAYSLATVGRGFEIAVTPGNITLPEPLTGTFAAKAKEFIRRNEAAKETSDTLKNAKDEARAALLDNYLADRAAGRAPSAFKGVANDGTEAEILVRRQRSAVEPDIGEYVEKIERFKEEASARAEKGRPFISTRETGKGRLAKAQKAGAIVETEEAAPVTLPAKATLSDIIKTEFGKEHIIIGRPKPPEQVAAPAVSPESPEFGANNTIVTRAKMESALDRLRQKVNRAPNIDTLIKDERGNLDPNILGDLLEVGTFYVEGGVREFKAWSEKMIVDLTEKVNAAFADGIKPYLKNIFDEIKRRRPGLFRAPKAVPTEKAGLFGEPEPTAPTNILQAAAQKAKEEKAKKPIAPTPAEPKAAKEPWEMTQAMFSEYLQNKQSEAIEKWNKARKGFPPTVDKLFVTDMVKLAERAGVDPNSLIGNFNKNKWHELEVRAAIREGKSIPANVLADYPDLAKKAEKPAERFTRANFQTALDRLEQIGNLRKGESKLVAAITDAFANKWAEWNNSTPEEFYATAFKNIETQTAEEFAKKYGIDLEKQLDEFRKTELIGKPSSYYRAATGWMNGKAVVSIFENAKLDTVLHELGHVIQNFLPEDQQRILREWASGGKVDLATPWTVDEKEKFARAWERYLLAGEVPNQQLKPIFQRLKELLTEIYKVLHKPGLFKIELTPEVRRVLDGIFEEGVPTRAESPVAPPTNIIQQAARAATEQAALSADIVKTKFGGTLADGRKLINKNIASRGGAQGVVKDNPNRDIVEYKEANGVPRYAVVERISTQVENPTTKVEEKPVAAKGMTTEETETLIQRAREVQGEIISRGEMATKSKVEDWLMNTYNLTRGEAHDITNAIQERNLQPIMPTGVEPLTPEETREAYKKELRERLKAQKSEETQAVTPKAKTEPVNLAFTPKEFTKSRDAVMATPEQKAWADTPYKQALLRALGGDIGLAKEAEQGIRSKMPDDFNATEARQRVVKGAIYEYVQDEDTTEKVFKALQAEQPSAPTAEPELREINDGFRTLANLIKIRLERGVKFDNPALTVLAEEAFGGTRAEGKYTPKDAYDALELAVNEFIADSPGLMTIDSEAALRTLRDLMRILPRQADRTLEQAQFQQFSTPPTQAFVAAKMLNPQEGETVLEPSAGVGGLAVFAKIAGANVHTNEISPRRAELLRMQGYTVSEVDAEILNDVLPRDIRPTAILMNPPFSATGGRVVRNKTEYGAKHVESALARLENGGRLVAIVGQGMAMDRPTFTEWWKKIAKRYNVRANIGIPGDEFGKYGTTFDNQIIVIDKTGPTPGNNWAEQTNNIVKGDVANLEEALNVTAEIAADRKAVTPTVRPETGTRPLAEGEGVVQPEPGIGLRPTPGRGGMAEPGRRPGEIRGATRPAGPAEGAPTVRAGEPGLEPTQVIERPGEPAEEPGVPIRGGRPEVVRPGAGEPAVAPGIAVPEESAELEKVETGAVREAEESGKFVKYKPAKLKGGVPHPANIVESASMAAVDPPDITYVVSLPADIIKEGKLSDLQLETVHYAGQQYEKIMPDGQRMGYFIGDGTGVGKGRQISGIIVDRWNKGAKRILWVSASRDLMEDAKRDIDDLGIDIPINIINDYAPGTDIELPQGVIFSTYQSLIGKSKSGNKQTRQKQLENWLGDNSVIIFDEAHKAKNALAVGGMGEPSQTAQAVIDIQSNLPKAGVVYASATGATDVRNMAYMTRLGLWGPGTAFPEGFIQFLTEIGTGGVGAMEMVSRDMKALGMYSSRSISFEGVDYREVIHELAPDQKRIYNIAAQAWQVVMQNIEAAIEATNGGERQKAHAMSAFWGAHQRFFKQIITAMKVPTAIKEVERAISENKSAVLSIIGTGESRTKDLINKANAEGSALEDLDFSPRETVANFINQSFPTVLFQDKTDPNTGKTIKDVVLDAQGNPVHSQEALRMKEALLEKLSDLSLPENPLDQVVNYFGADKIAEMTGRKRRLIRNKKTGKVEYVKRAPDDVAMNKTNLYEMKQLQDGNKRIAIISDAAATGISLHASNRAKNKQRRVHITLELGWSADKQMQTFGRTHRTDQASAPEYVLLSTDAGGEKRFSSTIARRLASLGALTKGQRDATGGGDLAKYNFETDEGASGVSQLYLSIMSGHGALGLDKLENPQQALRDMGILKKRGITGEEDIDRDDWTNVTRFLNRVLALDIERQNAIFDAFVGHFEEVVKNAKENGTFDDGVADIKGESIRLIGKPEIVHKDKNTGAETRHYTVEVDVKTTPVAFATARDEIENRPEGSFFKNNRSGNVFYGFQVGSKTDAATGEVKKRFRLTNPNNADRYLDLKELDERYEKLTYSDAKKLWNAEYEKVPKIDTLEKHIIGGAILPIWQRLKTQDAHGLKVARVTTDDGKRIVGVLIPQENLGAVLRAIGISRTLREAPDIFNAVLYQGDAVPLVGGMTLKKSRVHGDDTIELTGADYYKFNELRRLGLINEQIEWKQRFFIPTDEKKGVEVLKSLLETYPAIEEKPPALEGEPSFDIAVPYEPTPERDLKDAVAEAIKRARQAEGDRTAKSTEQGQKKEAGFTPDDIAAIGHRINEIIAGKKDLKSLTPDQRKGLDNLIAALQTVGKGQEEKAKLSFADRIAFNNAIKQLKTKEARVTIAKIRQAIKDEKEVEPTLLDKIAEWTASMYIWRLGSAGKSISSNLAMNLLQYPEIKMAAWFNKGVAQRNKVPIQIRPQEATQDFQAAWMGGHMKDAWREAMRYMKEETNVEQSEFFKRENIKARAIKGPAGRYIRAGLNAQAAIDVFFRTIAIEGEIARQTFRKAMQKTEDRVAALKLSEEYRAKIKMVDALQKGGKEIPEELAEFEEILNNAKKHVLVETFQEELHGIFAALSSSRRHALVRIFVPFFNTQMNILKQAFLRTPFAAAHSEFLELGKKAIQKRLTQEEAGELSERLARMTTGTLAFGMMLLLLHWMGDDDEVTGDWDINKLPEKPLGWQANSVRIGNRYISYQGIEPFATMFRVIGNIRESKQQGLNAFIDGLAQVTLNNQLTQEIFDIVDTAKQGKADEFFIKMVAGMALPGIAQDVSKIIDPTARRKDTLLQKGLAQTGIPGYTTTLPPVVDVFGQGILPQTRGERAFKSLTGLGISSVKDDPARAEIQRIGLKMSVRSFTHNKVKLTPDEALRLNQMIGERFHQQVIALLKNPTYKAKSDDGKKKVIVSVRTKLLNHYKKMLEREPAFRERMKAIKQEGGESASKTPSIFQFAQ